MHTGHLATGRKARFSAFKQCAGQATVHRGRTTKEREKQRPVHTHPQSMHTHKKTQTHTPAHTHRHPHTQTKTTTHSKANSFLCREPAMRVSEQVHPTADTCTTQNVQQAPKICKLHTVAACSNPPTRLHRVNDIVIVCTPPTQIQPASHLLCLFQAQVITSLSASGPVAVWLLGSSSSSGCKRGYHTLAISTDMRKIDLPSGTKVCSFHSFSASAAASAAAASGGRGSS